MYIIIKETKSPGDLVVPRAALKAIGITTGDRKVEIVSDGREIRIRAVKEGERDTPTPLTLDELRERDGKPVWTVGTIHPHYSEWALVNADDGYVVCKNSCVAGFNTYGAKEFGWLAYDRPPKEGDRDG